MLWVSKVLQQLQQNKNKETKRNRKERSSYYPYCILLITANSVNIAVAIPATNPK